MNKGAFPFYPLIVAAFPVVSVYSANLAYVPPAHLWRPLLLSLAASAAVWLLLSLALRNAARGAAGTTVLILCFFGYSWFAGRIAGTTDVYGIPPTLPWGIATAALVALAAWKIKEAKALNVLSSFIAVIAIANVGLRLTQALNLGARVPRAALTASSEGARPDIVYIILDGYGRSDSVKRAIGYDNSAFVDGLKKRGFYVAEKSRANYCQTELSLASSLNMETIQALLPNVKKDTEERKPLADLMDDNEVARRMRAKGYRFVAITTGFPPASFESADLNLRQQAGGTMVETALLRMTPLGVQDFELESQVPIRRRNLLAAFDSLESLAQPTINPRFVIAHILAPHPPFVFDADGGPRKPEKPFGFFDGSDYMTFVGTPADYRRGWKAQAEFIGKRLLTALDRMLDRPGPKPIVIVQGDHGSKVGLDQNSLEKTDLQECFPILNAYLVPKSVGEDLKPDITPVNTFRLLLRDLFGDDLPALPNRSWYSRYSTPYDFEDVTDRVVDQ